MIRAILRAQFLSMRTLRRGSSRRGAVFSLVVTLAWYGLWAGKIGRASCRERV